MDRPFGLAPQRLGYNRDEVCGLGQRYGLRPPRCCMLGVSDEEQQPGDGDFRLDMDLHIPDPGRADLSGRTNQPEPRAERRWRGADDA